MPSKHQREVRKWTDKELIAAVRDRLDTGSDCRFADEADVFLGEVFLRWLKEKSKVDGVEVPPGRKTARHG